MKVYIGPYIHWYGPYQLAETLCFWAKDEVDDFGIKSKPDWVHKFGEFLAGKKKDSYLYKFMNWIHSKRKRKIKVRIDPYDVWGMDHTLAEIVLPMLKKLQKVKHGSPYVDLEDVPEELRSTNSEGHDGQKSFDFYTEKDDVDYEITHKRWEWVLNEMIFAFEKKLDDDWEDEFRSGTIDMQWVESDKLYNGEKCYQMIRGPKDTYVCDYDGIQKVQERISNGFRLFGKYYEGLWD